MHSLTAFNDRLQSLLHYDFCPQWNRWVYWMKHPLCGLLTIGLVSAVCGILVNPYAWSVVMFVAVIGLLGLVWPWIAIRGIECQIHFQERRTRAGQPANVRLKIRNHFPWPVWGLSLQRGFAVQNLNHEGIALSCVSGWSTVEFTWSFLPECRGVYPRELPVIETGFPFGLCLGARKTTCVGQLIVWPRSVPLSSMPDAAEIDPREQRFADRRVGDLGDVLGTREFRTGDSLRRVHWSQTARYRRLIVTERQAPAACAVQLLIDVDASSHDGAIPDGTLEQTLRVAASLCESLHANHSRMECLIADSRYSIGESQSDLHRVLDHLAGIPAGGERDPAALCRFHGPRHTSRIIVTTPLAFAKHLGHRHSSSGDRFILVHPHQATAVDLQTGACPCRPWLEVQSDELLEQVLAQRWGQACHA